MKAIQLHIRGNWAQFRKAETNNNPLTHSIMTKTALVGLMGAVIGIERQDMRRQFPVLCKGLLFGLQVNNAVVKQSWGFTMRQLNHAWEKSPKQMEFIKSPDYTILIGLKDQACGSAFNKFTQYCKAGKSCFTPVLGLHNCPAEIDLISEGTLVKGSGEFDTYGFVTNEYTPKIESLSTFRIGFDKIPTYQNDDFWNLPKGFVPIVYPSEGSRLNVTGEYYEYNGELRWCMI